MKELKDIYNYQKNINVVTTTRGDKVVTMNREIFDVLVNHLYDAAKLQDIEEHHATAEDTRELWRALLRAEERGM